MRETIDDVAIRTISVVNLERIDKPTIKNFGGLGQTVELYNYLSVPVQVCTRSGLTHELLPQSIRGNGVNGPGVMIVLSYTGAARNVRIDARHLLNEPNTELQYGLGDNYQEGGMTGKDTTSVHLWLSKDTIESRNGVLYCPEVDMQISLLDLFKTPPHPFSPAGLLFHDKIDNEYFESDNHMAFSMSLIDNENTFGTRYINLYETVFELKAIRDVKRASGLYITKNGISSIHGKRKPLEVEFIPLDKIAETIKDSYSSPVEAKALGTYREIQKKELEDKEDLIKRQEQEIKLKRQELEKDIIKSKIKIDEMSLEAHINKIRSEDVKRDRDELRDAIIEERARGAHLRKEALEMLKMVPAVVTLVITLAGIYNKS